MVSQVTFLFVQLKIVILESEMLPGEASPVIKGLFSNLWRVGYVVSVYAVLVCYACLL